MGMYTMQDLLKRWRVGDLTVEQAIGQILQHLALLYDQGKPSGHRSAQGRGGDDGSASKS